MVSQADKLYLVSQLQRFQSTEELQMVVTDWLSLARILLEIESFYLNREDDSQPFELAKFTEVIEQISLSDKKEVVLALKSSLGEFTLQLHQGVLHERILLNPEIFMNSQALILDYLNRRMEKYGVYAYIRSLEEYLSHNVQSISDRAAESLNYPKELPQMYNQNQEVIVDCSRLAGYDFDYHNLCFTSCWKMWFSPAYYHLIPRKAFLDVQQVDAIEELAQQVILITLYDDPFQWQKPRNIDFQFLFRDQLGFDHFDWSNGVGVLREPYAEFIQLGGRTQMIQYQNSSLQPTAKSQARHFTTHLFNLADGEHLEGRRFGRLNERAYFPWQDGLQKTMLAYWILNPFYMLDAGVNAFEFYIKQYVFANLKSESEEDYQAILRFYVPGELIPQLPLKKLSEDLAAEGISLKNQRQVQGKELLLLESDVRQLQVEFLDVAELEQTNKKEKASKPPVKKRRTKIKQFIKQLKDYSPLA